MAPHPSPPRPLLELLLAHQRRMEIFVSKAGPPLDVLEGYLLALLHAGECSYSSEIVSHVGLDKTRISRSLAGLEALKYISSSPGPADGRQRLLKLTPSGLTALERNNRILSTAALECVAPLSASEVSELERLFRKLADSFACPPPIHSPKLHPLLSELRRLSRAFGILNSQFAATKLNTAEFQLLRGLCGATALRAVDLSRQSGLPKSTVSRAIQSLIEQGYIEAKRDPTDGRNSLLETTADGERTIKEALDRASALLSAALVPLGSSYGRRFTKLLEKYVGQQPDTIESGLSVTEIKGAREKQEACLFVVHQLLRQGKEDHIDANIFFDDSRIFAARDGNQFVGVCEFRKRGNAWALRRAIIAADWPRLGSKAEKEVAAAAERLCSQTPFSS